MNEQNSGENSCPDSEGDGSSRICHHSLEKTRMRCDDGLKLVYVIHLDYI